MLNPKRFAIQMLIGAWFVPSTLPVVETTTAHAQTLRTIALTGQEAPATSGALFGALFTPILNDAGQILFGGRLATGAGISSPNDVALWVQMGDSTRLVVREGDQAPGAPSGVKLEGLFGQAMNGLGRVTFQSSLTGPGVTSSNDEGIWTDAEGPVRLVARLGDVAPGAGGSAFRYFFLPQINNGGQVGFPAGITPGASGDYGNWVERNNALNLVATRGTPAPGFANGATFTNTSGLVLSHTGNVAFSAVTSATTTDPVFLDVTGLWVDQNGAQSLLARRDMPAPGAPDGMYFLAFSNIAYSQDRIAFTAGLRNESLLVPEEAGVWKTDGASLQPILVFGDQAPGAPAGASLRRVNALRLNDSGETAFMATLTVNAVTPQTQTAIFSETDGVLGLVARQGDHPPGVASSVQFSTFPTSSFVFNDAGQIAFSAMISGGDVNLPLGRNIPPEFINDHGIWGQDRSGLLRLVIRAGDIIDVDDGPGVDLRRVQNLNFFGQGGSDGRGREGFNAHGQLAFSATFTDGTSGVFLSTVLAVPEPAAAPLIVSAVLAALKLQRRPPRT